jgi:hypothetical protein
MNAKPFIFAVAAVVVLGIIIGGAFIGGVALGRTQAESEEPEMSFIQAPSAQGGVAAAGGGGELSQAQIQEIRQQIRQQAQAGGIDPEEAQRIVSQIGPDGGTGGGAAPGTGVVITSLADAGGRTMGTVKSVEDGIMTVETFQGTIQVNVDADTKIQGLAEVPLSEVEVDSIAVVVGERTDSGEYDASSVILLPEGVLGAGGFRRPGAGAAGGGRAGQ